MRPEPALELAHPVALIAVGHPSWLQITETASMLQPLYYTPFPTPPGLSLPLSHYTCFHHPLASAPWLFLLQQWIKTVTGQGRKKQVKNYFLHKLFILQTQI